MSSSFEFGPEKQTGAHWVERKPIPTERDFFKFELEFAKQIQRRTNEPLIDVVSAYTWKLQNSLFDYNFALEKWETEKWINFDKEEEMIDLARDVELDRIRFTDEVRYNDSHRTYEGARFGCFHYDYPSSSIENAINIHFTNYENAADSPLSEDCLPGRQQEMKDLLIDVKNFHPEVENVAGKSWLYNLPHYRRLFPASYIANLAIKDEFSNWSEGSMIWGQFINSQGKLKRERAMAFLNGLMELPQETPLSKLHQEGLLLLPYSTHGPIADFNNMYGLEA